MAARCCRGFTSKATGIVSEALVERSCSMKIGLSSLALVTEPQSIARYLRGIGEPTDVPKRMPARGPPYWASRVLRQSASSVEAAE